MLAKAPITRSVPRSGSRVNTFPNEKVQSRSRTRLRAATDTRLSLGARVLYVLLDDYAGMKAECWPHQKTAAERLGKSVRSVKRWIAELVQTGYITIRRTQCGNRYKLAWAETVPGSNGSTSFGPSGVPARTHRFKEPVQELHPRNSNSSQTPDIGEDWEFGMDGAVGLFNWASMAPGE
jgi:hypothetical protein